MLNNNSFQKHTQRCALSNVVRDIGKTMNCPLAHFYPLLRREMHDRNRHYLRFANTDRVLAHVLATQNSRLNETDKQKVKQNRVFKLVQRSIKRRCASPLNCKVC